MWVLLNASIDDVRVTLKKKEVCAKIRSLCKGVKNLFFVPTSSCWIGTICIGTVEHFHVAVLCLQEVQCCSWWGLCARMLETERLFLTLSNRPRLSSSRHQSQVRQILQLKICPIIALTKLFNLIKAVYVEDSFSHDRTR